MGVVSPVVYTLTYVYLIMNFFTGKIYEEEKKFSRYKKKVKIVFLIEVNALNTPPRNYKRKFET